MDGQLLANKFASMGFDSYIANSAKCLLKCCFCTITKAPHLNKQPFAHRAMSKKQWVKYRFFFTTELQNLPTILVLIQPLCRQPTCKWSRGGGVKTHKSLMLHNGVFTLPAHTSTSTEQTGPALSRSGPGNHREHMEHFKHSKPPWAWAVVAPMNYRNDLIVFSFGNTGGPRLCVSVLTACGFQRGTWFSATYARCVCWIQGGPSRQNRASAEVRVQPVAVN